MDRYDQQEIDPWANSLRGIGHALVQMPAIRAAARAREQHGQLIEAQTRHADASAESERQQGNFYHAKAADEESQTSSGSRLAAALKKVATNPNDTNAVGDSLAELGHYFKRNPQEAANGFRTMLTTLTANAGKTDPKQLAVLNGDADRVYATDEHNSLVERLAAEKPIVAGNGSTIFAPDGTPLGQAAANIPQGNVRTMPSGGGAAAPVGNVGIAPAPKTPLAEGIRAQLLKSLLSDPNFDTNNLPGILQRFDSSMPKTSEPTPPARVSPQGTATPANASQLIQEAQQAIQRGADPAKVKARLAQMGIQLQ